MKRSCISEGWYFKDITERWYLRGTPEPEYQKIDLPHDYQITQKRDSSLTFRTGFYPDKHGKYVKFLSLDKGRHYILDVDGAYCNSHVYLNQDLLTIHPHGYTPILVDLSESLLDGTTNKLVIETMAPEKTARWYSGNGIYRDVFLWEGGALRIEPRDIFVSTTAIGDESADICIAYKITSDESATVSTVFKVFDADEEVASLTDVLTVGKGKSSERRRTVTVPYAKLWSVDTPNLYTLRAYVYNGGELADEAELTFGIRTISADAKRGLLVNGKPLKLRGGCIHHDHGDLGAIALPAAEERKIRILKESGFNAIRTAHNPPSISLLEACDKLGMVVMDEAFDMWNHRKNPNDYHLFFADHYAKDIKAMVERDRNHPSVFSYSIGNEILEIGGNSKAGEWAHKLADEIRKYDSTRFVTSGIQKEFSYRGDVKIESIDPDDYREFLETTCTKEPRGVNARTLAFESALDIIGVNYYYHNYEIEHEMYPDRVFWGSETHTVHFYDSWSKTKDAPHILGDFTWTCYDNLGEAGAGRFGWESDGVDCTKPLPLVPSPFPWRTCFQGDHDICGYRLPQSYFREAVWIGGKEPRIFTTHPKHFGEAFTGTEWHWFDVKETWTYPDEYIGKPIKAEVYTDADSIRWYVNGEFIGESVPEGAIAYLETVYAPGEIRAVAIKGNEAISEYTLKTTKETKNLALTPEACQIKADGRDLLYVKIAITDEEGLTCVNDTRHLSCSVEGGKLLALFSGDPKSDIPADVLECDTFMGKALAVISAKEAGKITVTVNGSGIGTATVTAYAE